MGNLGNSGNAWKWNNRPRYLAWARQWNKAKRLQERANALSAYGGRCVCCGETEPAFLCIDHVGGGGSQHRQVIGNGGGTMYAFLRRVGYPKDGFRVLCHNCNLADAYYGQCPHVERMAHAKHV